MTKKVPVRDAYTVKTLLKDLKKLNLTPNALYTIGTEVIYYEWQKASEDLGEEDPITIYLGEMLSFMQKDYERNLLEGELRRESDTPSATINSFLRDTPTEFQSYLLHRSGAYISGVLRAVEASNKREMERFERMEKNLSEELKKKPNDPELLNQFRLALWILGRYEEASAAFKKAKKHGWDKKKTKTVGI
ncbi:MAG: hypothetical protein EAX95_10700 [Candidatus Thorarchaeota archaeon]|nr:hypothetical protein [Candidatus Thorarchaeota archaeon]